MITDEERREVAARMRNLDYSDLQESLICAYLDALGIDGYADWVGIAHRLADLIEPPRQCPYYDSDRHYCSIHDVPAMDRDALLALADKMSRYASLRKSHGMDVDTMAVMAWVHRIREACGEVEPCDERS